MLDENVIEMDSDCVHFKFPVKWGVGMRSDLIG